MKCLLDRVEDKKVLIIFNKTNTKLTQIRFLNHKIAPFFRNLFDKAFSINFFGGTMKPLIDFRHLFKSLSINFKFFDYPHVIDKSNYQVISLAQSANPYFQFTYKNLQNKQLYRDALRYLSKILSKVPQGMVIFFSSYKILIEFQTHLKELMKQSQTIFLNKKLYFDGKLRKTSLDMNQRIEKEENDLLKSFSNYLNEDVSHTAVLWSVMGGILSEGINFKDHLARAVICVGVPFPNLSSPEIDQKLNRISKGQYSKS